MNTMKKRVLSSLLAVSAAVSMSAPAFAAYETDVVATYSEPVIAVVVPGDTTASINPYGIGITETKSDTTTKVQLKGQIVSKPMTIKNQSDMDLKVGAKVSTVVTAGSDANAVPMRLEKTSTKAVEADPEHGIEAVAAKTTKSAFVQLQIVAGPASLALSEKVGDATTENALKDAIIDAVAAPATWTSAKALTLDSVKAVEMTEMATLKKVTSVTGTGASGDPYIYEYGAGSIGLVRLTGDCVATPAATPWTTDDSFTATIVFSFIPV